MRSSWLFGALAFALLACGESQSKEGDDESQGGSGAGAQAGSAGASLGGSAGSAAGGSANAGSANGGNANGGSATGGSSMGGAAGSSPMGSFPRGFGPAEPLLTGLTRPVRLGLKDGYLYFTEMGLENGSMSRLARRDASGNVETLFPGTMVTALHMDDDELFFVERGTNTIYRMRYATLEPEVFATTTLMVADLDRLGEAIWTTEFVTTPMMTTAVTLYDRSGAVTSQPVPPTSTNFIFSYLAVGGGVVYLSTIGTGAALYKLPPSGTGGVSVAGVQPGFISADASHVYFTSQSDGRALRQRHDVDMQPEELGGGPEAFAITVDGDGAYWTNRGLDCEAAAPSGGSVYGVPLAGGTSVAISTGERCSEAIVSDGDYVYWTRSAGIDVASDDSIVRARKLR